MLSCKAINKGMPENPLVRLNKVADLLSQAHHELILGRFPSQLRREISAAKDAIEKLRYYVNEEREVQRMLIRQAELLEKAS